MQDKEQQQGTKRFKKNQMDFFIFIFFLKGIEIERKDLLSTGIEISATMFVSNGIEQSATMSRKTSALLPIEG